MYWNPAQLGNSLKHQAEHKIQKSTLPAKLPKLIEEWRVSSKFKPTNCIFQGYAQILQMTIGGKSGNVGDRNEVFVKSSRFEKMSLCFQSHVQSRLMWLRMRNTGLPCGSDVNSFVQPDVSISNHSAPYSISVLLSCPPALLIHKTKGVCIVTTLNGKPPVDQMAFLAF